MAKTTFNKISSQDILSAHINGLGTAINNIETVLDMKTTTISGHILNVVNDMEEVENRNRVYEGTVRCWLSSPTPVIKKNGVVVSSTEYVIQPAFGVVVFKNPLSASDVVTADVTYVSNASNKIETIDTRLTDLEGRPSGGGSSLSYPTVIMRYNTDYLCNSTTGYMPKQICTNGGGGISTASNSIETFPMIAPEDCTIDKIMCKLAVAKASSYVIMGVYDSEGGEPTTLLASTGRVVTDVGGDIFGEVNLTLQKGKLYYLSIYYSSALSINGVHHSQALELEPELGYRNCVGSDLLTTKTTAECKGIRMTTNVFGTIGTSLPATHPKSSGFTVSDFMYIGRVGYCTPFLHIKR